MATSFIQSITKKIADHYIFPIFDWSYQNRKILLNYLLHVFSIVVFVTMYFGLKKWLPVSVPSQDLESSVQLLGQVLALVVGVLLLGTTVSLSSYDGSDALSEIHTKIADATIPLFQRFFARGPDRDVLDIRDFRRRLMLRPRVKKLLFSKIVDDKYIEQWYIRRPSWDGAWFQVYFSPFNTKESSKTQLAQVQRLHEAVICASIVLQQIYDFRISGGALINRGNGTEGSKSYLKRFEECKAKKLYKLSFECTIDDALTIVSLAIDSSHYMQDEFRNHEKNIEWTPFALTAFQLNYVDYAKAMCHLIQKLQLLRLANMEQKAGYLPSKLNDLLDEKLWYSKLKDTQTSLASLRSRIVTAHGAARYFHQIKNWSMPGIGVALVVLITMLCSWPYLKWTALPSVRLEGFIVLYSAAIASLSESSFFLARLLWKRRAIY